MQPARFLILGFGTIILLGTLLLCLPISSRSGQFTNLVDCFFTATSATCVTGITVFDTYTHFSFFGQGVILMLFQIGGLGFLAFVTFFNFLLGKKMGWSSVKTAAADFTSDALLTPRKLFSEIIIYSLAIELVGSLLLMTVFVPDFGAYGVFMSVFMAVSSFCNAGFDVMTVTGISGGIESYADNPIVLLTLLLMILLGGMGYLVWQNLVHYRKIKRLTLHTKIVLLMTAALTTIAFITIFAAEYNNPDTLGNMSLTDKLTNTAFLSVSARTAGINSFNPAGFTSFTKLIITLLMFIGAAPASTGGGIKVTTAAVILATVISVLKGDEETHILGHRLKKDAILKTMTVLALSMVLVMISFVAVYRCLPDLPMKDVFFEVVSGFSTCGSSLGVSSQLDSVGKIAMIFTMFAGRVGPVTLMMSLMIRNKKHSKNKILPEDDILVG
ncbi:MAG: potassium transporter Trk [Ruminiclostridium sp.]|nr:potassium transporter Trk [Ruminiclostridium sp.]